MKILDGKKTASEIRADLKLQILELKKKGIVPGLAVILAGNDPASQVYVKNKRKACKETGIYSEIHELSENISQEELEKIIKQLNQNKKIHGILVQLPLPKHLDTQRIIEKINPKKDVDCFHPENIGRVMIGNGVLLPCTPAGAMELLKKYNVPIDGQDAVIIGKSNIVGKPMALMLLNENATVTVCHSKTKDLKSYTTGADILIVAAGKLNLISEDMVKPGAVVIDVGISRLTSGKIAGDVDFERVKNVASAITPVPGGVGPMTIALLLKNTVASARGFNLRTTK